MTPQAQQSSLMSLMSLSPLSALAGGAGASSFLKDPNAIYVGILKSHTIASNLIQRFNLRAVYKRKLESRLEKKLASNSDFSSGKDSLIKIEFTDKDPVRAAAVANGYVDELFSQNSRLALTEAAHRRQFFESQLATEKDHLADAEVDLKKTQEETGLFQANAQAMASISAIETLRANITARQVELQSLQQAATAENPQVVRLQTELKEMRAQLQALQQKAGNGPGDVFVPTAKVPEVALIYMRKLREVKYHETLFELLARQFEVAKLDEAKTAPAIQVVDRADVPDRKSGPHRTLIVLGGGILGVVFIVFYVMAREYLRTMSNDVETGPKMAFIRQRLAVRSRSARLRGSEQ
jgi:capsule polysaccharide export protein KpsE/RkpR